MLGRIEDFSRLDDEFAARLLLFFCYHNVDEMVCQRLKERVTEEQVKELFTDGLSVPFVCLLFAKTARLSDFLELTGFGIFDDICQYRGCNVIHLACLKGDKPALQCLLIHCDTSDLERRAEKNHTGEIHDFIEAMQNMSIDLRSDLIQHLSAKVQGRIKSLQRFIGVVGYAPLHIAAEKGDGEMCEILLLKGANINARTSNGWMTPLYLAVMNDHTSVALRLLELGANYNLSDDLGNFAYDVALDKKNKVLVNKFLNLNNANHRMEDAVVAAIKRKLEIE